MSSYFVIFETAEDGTVSAYVPDLPVILVSGCNHDEARKAVSEAIRIYREELMHMGVPMPKPSMQHEMLTV